jgi:hypothetical protein
MARIKLSHCTLMSCWIFLLALLLFPVPSHAVLYYGPAAMERVLYHGILSAPSGLHTQGRWAGGPSSIEWWVSANSSKSGWTYRYQLTHPVGETSHVILETSVGFTLADVTNAFVNDSNGNMVSYALASGDIGNHTQQQGNPDMPTDLFGIKFDKGITGLVTKIQFDSRRAPTWGDFYAKDGGHDPVDAAWNLGFANPDPLDPPSDGSIGNHLLVPDTVVSPVPEPTSLLLLGMGLIGAAGVLGRKKKNS